MMLPRPKLHEFLYSKVRSDKVHFSKKVLSILQNKEGAMIRCADGTTYHGDLIVGADGAYSGVMFQSAHAIRPGSPYSASVEYHEDFVPNYCCCHFRSGNPCTNSFRRRTFRPPVTARR